MKRKYNKIIFDEFKIEPYSYFYTKTLFDRYVPHNRKAKILDVGVGAGRMLRNLKYHGFNNLYAIDVDLQYKKHLANEGIKVKQCNLEKDKIPFKDNTFDIVVSFHVVEHVRNSNNYFLEIRRVLKKGGLFICETPDFSKTYKKIFYSDPTHVTPLQLDSLKKVFKMYDYEIIYAAPSGTYSPIQKAYNLIGKFVKKNKTDYSSLKQQNTRMSNDINFKLWKMVYSINSRLFLMPFLRHDIIIVGKKT